MKSFNWLLIVLVGITLSGCAVGPHKSEFLAEQASSLDPSEPRQLVKTAEQKIRVKKLDEATQQVVLITEQAGGYVEHQNSGDDYSSVTVRVPSERLDETMKNVGSIGHEFSKRVNVDDVSKQLIDLKARLQNAVALRDRLRELSKQAKKVSEILEI